MARFMMALLATVAGIGAVARAGGPPPVYVVVDKVVLEPSTDAPDRVQIWGSFVRLENVEGYKYGKPIEGYVYLSSATGKEAESRAEWKKWQKAAGTGKVVAAGWCKEAGSLLTAAIHKPDDRVTKPDAAYTPGHISSLDAARDMEKETPVKDLLVFVKDRQDSKTSARK